MSFVRKYMERAIELAVKGEGAVNPNPLVGAVIVRNGRIIGEGYHTKYGSLHAEREALKNAAERGEDVTGAEMYVTLEPCSHTGKQPPCTAAVIEAGISKVYIGSSDPNPLVAGKGILQLMAAGIEVETGCMKEECDALNPVFFHYITKKRPYVVYKYAMTMDGKTSTKTGKSKWISCEKSRNIVQHMRSKYMAIMVGIGTVLKDDPLLKCHREAFAGEDVIIRDPVRIVVDSKLRIPMESQLVKTAGEVKTYVATLSKYENDNKDKLEELRSHGVEIIFTSSDSKDEVDLEDMFEQLGSLGIDSVLLEGGGRLAWSVVKEGFVQEVHLFMAPKMFGGWEAPTPLTGFGVEEVDEAALFRLKDVSITDSDIYARYVRK